MRCRPYFAVSVFAIAAALSGCSDLTGGSNCSYGGAVPGLTISAIDGTTQHAPSSTPVIAAAASDGKVTNSVGGIVNGDSLVVSDYIGAGTYTVTITTGGYQTINMGKVLISDNPDGACDEPATQRIPVTLTRTTSAPPR
ncbi:MAG TPA: hypothetical protein VMH39_07385 [Gemmatimonadaceae bacterium]|nr:hypothetical protein [Gemmatimonadaceae bacterium]